MRCLQHSIASNGILKWSLIKTTVHTTLVHNNRQISFFSDCGKRVSPVRLNLFMFPAWALMESLLGRSFPMPRKPILLFKVLASSSRLCNKVYGPNLIYSHNVSGTGNHWILFLDNIFKWIIRKDNLPSKTSTAICAIVNLKYPLVRVIV